MRRVAVIGCGGAGKTRLARELGARLGLPVVHVDELVHGRGAERPEREWQAELGARADEEEWVIDAMKASVLEHRVDRADTVVFLDLPRRTCYLGLVQRRLWRRDLLNPGFLRSIWRFRRDVRPRVHAVLRAHAATTRVVVLRTRREARAFLASLPRATVDSRQPVFDTPLAWQPPRAAGRHGRLRLQQGGLASRARRLRVLPAADRRAAERTRRAPTPRAALACGGRLVRLRHA